VIPFGSLIGYQAGFAVAVNNVRVSIMSAFLTYGGFIAIVVLVGLLILLAADAIFCAIACYEGYRCPDNP
jgi:hypothetical protein